MAYLKVLPFPLPSSIRSRREVFSSIHYENLGEPEQVKLNKSVGAFQGQGSLGASASQLHLQLFIKYTSCFPVLALISAEASILVGSCSLYPSVCLPNLGVEWRRMGSGLLCYLISFIGLRKCLNFFSLFSVLLVVRM